MTDRELMKMALDALRGDEDKQYEAIKALRDRLAQLEEVPCKTHPEAPHGFDRNASHSEDRYICECESWEPPIESVHDSDIISECDDETAKYRHEWVGLTDEEIDYLEDAIDPAMYRVFARRIEAKLKEKNT